MGKIKYQDKWEKNPLYQDWICRDPTISRNREKAYCNFCKKTLTATTTFHLNRHLNQSNFYKQIQILRSKSMNINDDVVVSDVNNGNSCINIESSPDGAMQLVNTIANANYNNKDFIELVKNKTNGPPSVDNLTNVKLPIENQSTDVNAYKYIHVYNKNWETMFPWIAPVENNPTLALCTTCNSTLSTSISVLKFHDVCNKHKENSIEFDNEKAEIEIK